MRIVCSAVVVLSLVACSSGGGTPVVQLPVTSANGQSVAEAALEGLDNMFGGTQFSLQTQPDDHGGRRVVHGHRRVQLHAVR